MQWAQQAIDKAYAYVPEGMRNTYKMRAFGALHVPVILYCMPRVEQLDTGACRLTIPLNWRTRNHYKSMYFGVMAVGADCAAGFLAQHCIEHSGTDVQLLFKDFHADFHRRAMADVAFTCPDGAQVAQMVQKAAASTQRINQQVRVVATVPQLNDEHVADFTLTLSLKQGRIAKEAQAKARQ
jgi:acyl-coenzyme A thioesterase PaaI-like protein